jgi:cupin fold WbuC family metalloprotein
VSDHAGRVRRASGHAEATAILPVAAPLVPPYNNAVHPIAPSDIAALLTEAEASPRRRSHLLLHAGHDDQVQRLLIALQPGSYVRPHQHSQQWEMLVLQRGRLDVLAFAPDGVVLARHRLDRAAPVIQIPARTWHAGVVLEPDTVVMEVKPGPYRPNEFADWAPEENTSAATDLASWLERALPGMRWDR